MTADFADAVGNGTPNLSGLMAPVVLQRLKYREKGWGAVF